jgi:hypothetical protein
MSEVDGDPHKLRMHLGLLPSVILAALFYGLRWAGVFSISVYVGETSFALILRFFIIAAPRFNSIGLVRRLCAERRTNPIFYIPHPIVEDLHERERPLKRVKKFCAIAFLETKTYTIAHGMTFVIFYFGLLYFLRGYNPPSLECTRSCEVFMFGIKSIGSGMLFDFFDAFHIKLSDIRNGSTYFLTAAFVAKIVFAGLVLRIITLYFSFRKRFRSVLRTSARTFDEKRLTARATEH